MVSVIRIVEVGQDNVEFKEKHFTAFVLQWPYRGALLFISHHETIKAQRKEIIATIT